MIPWHLRRSLGSCLPSLAITLRGEDMCSEFQVSDLHTVWKQSPSVAMGGLLMVFNHFFLSYGNFCSNNILLAGPQYKTGSTINKHSWDVGCGGGLEPVPTSSSAKCSINPWLILLSVWISEDQLDYWVDWEWFCVLHMGLFRTHERPLVEASVLF